MMRTEAFGVILFRRIRKADAIANAVFCNISSLQVNFVGKNKFVPQVHSDYLCHLDDDNVLFQGFFSYQNILGFQSSRVYGAA